MLGAFYVCILFFLLDPWSYLRLALRPPPPSPCSCSFPNSSSSSSCSRLSSVPPWCDFAPPPSSAPPPKSLPLKNTKVGLYPNHIVQSNLILPALQIQSTYPLSSRSSCCWRRSFRNSTRFSTRSLSLANSLEEKKKINGSRCQGNLLYVKKRREKIHVNVRTLAYKQFQFCEWKIFVFANILSSL